MGEEAAVSKEAAATVGSSRDADIRRKRPHERQQSNALSGFDSDWHPIAEAATSSTVWTDEAAAAYNRVFGPVVDQSKHVLGKRNIEALKSKNSVLKGISTLKIKNKINAHVQKLRRQEKSKSRRGESPVNAPKLGPMIK